MKPLALRPLGLGEIVDRALTLYLRNFATLTGTVLVVIFIPMSIGQFFLLDAQSGEFQTFFRILQHPGAAPPATPLADMISFPELMLGYLTLFFTAVLGLFANNAVAVNVAAVYTGRVPSVSAGLRATFRRWGALLGLFFLGLLIALSAYVLLFAMLFAGIFGIVGAAAALPAAMRSWPMITLLVLCGIVLFLAVVAIALLLVLAFTFAGYAVVIEGRSVIDAIGSGLSRVFNRKEWGRALVVLIVALLIGLGVSMVSGTVELLLLFVPGTQSIVAILSAIVAVAAAAVQTVFYAVYYYDVRIRREGFDLEMALQRL